MARPSLKYNLRLTPSPPDARDHIIRATAPVKTKEAIDLSSYCTVVKDQGVLGSCTAFAAVAAMEYLQRRYNENKSEDIYSERFTYYATRVNVLKWEPEDSGAYVRDAVKSLVKYGCCMEKTCPYTNDCKTAPSPKAYQEAEKYQALSYARFEDGASPDERRQLIQLLKANLASGMPIIAGFICYSNIWNAVRGVIPAKNGTIIGGHAILIVGYNDATGLFKFKNSWGRGWGDRGYGYLPYDYYISGDMFDLWSIRTSENTNAEVIGIGVSSGSAAASSTITTAEAIAGSTDILTTILGDLDNILSKDKKSTASLALIAKYKSNTQFVALIDAISTALGKLK